jgi:hypothetical protein
MTCINGTADGGTTNDELLAAALNIARKGGKPLPCAYGKKTPVPVHGLRDAAVVRDGEAWCQYWWGRGQLYNVADVTGFRSDVLDVDTGPEGSGFPAYNRLKEAGLLAGAFRVVRTPSGGLHVSFAASGQRCGSLRGLHLDFKALGGYVLVPPSQIGGRRYELLDERPPTGATLDWDACKALLVPPRPYRAPRSWRGSQRHLIRWLEGEFAGNRNNALFWSVCEALEAGDEDTADELAEVALSAGLTPDEVAKTISSAWKAADDGR